MRFTDIQNNTFKLANVELHFGKSVFQFMLFKILCHLTIWCLFLPEERKWEVAEKQDRASFVSSDLGKNFEKRTILTSAFLRKKLNPNNKACQQHYIVISKLRNYFVCLPKKQLWSQNYIYGYDTLSFKIFYSL